MKLVFVILTIIQVTFAQSPVNPEISAEDVTALHNAFAKLFSDGSVINDFAMKLEQRNGLDDQAINDIANAVVKEVSEYITSIATTLPNSTPFVNAVVSAIQEFDVLQEYLNKEGYKDAGIFGYVLVGIYNDVLLTLKAMAEPFVTTIRQLQGNSIAPPKPITKPDPATIENFKNSLTKIHQYVMEIAEHVESSKLISGIGQTATSGIVQRIDNLIQNILKTLDPTIAVNVRTIINDVFTQMITIMDIYEEYKGIDETKIIMQLVRSAYKSAISSFYKLELQAEQLPSTAPPAYDISRPLEFSAVSEQDPYHGIPPPPEFSAIHPNVESFQMVQTATAFDPSIRVNPPSIPIEIQLSPQEKYQRIALLQQKTDQDRQSLIYIMKTLIMQSGTKSDLLFMSIIQHTLQQFKNLADESFASQPTLNAQSNYIFEAINKDIAEWDKILKEGNQNVGTVFAQLLETIVSNLMNCFFIASQRPSNY